MNQFSVKGYAGGGAARIGSRFYRAGKKAGAELTPEEQAAIDAAEQERIRREKEIRPTRAAKQALRFAAQNKVPIRSTIRGAQRRAFPGVYMPPKVIAEEAEKNVAPESPNLEKLFGVRRRDLAQMAEKPGTAPAVVPGATRAPSRSVEQVMYPANTARLVDILQAGREYAPQLTEGMTGWYMMDPAYHRLVELVGPDEAAKRYQQLNALTSIASASSGVEEELRRGTAANFLANIGKFDLFAKYGGMDLDERLKERLPDYLTSFPGHLAHKTAHVPSMRGYLESGGLLLPDTSKTFYYLNASMPDILGRQSNIPVGDAHYVRGIGLADTRDPTMDRGQVLLPKGSITLAELRSIAPWFRKQVAQQAGYEAVPAQANMWGLLAPQTGVETRVGAPKLEILADLIARTARSRNIPLHEARDLVLTGQLQAGMAKGGKVEANPNVAYDQVAPELQDIINLLAPMYAGAASNIKSENRRLPQSAALSIPGLREIALMTRYANLKDLPGHGLSKGLMATPSLALMVKPELSDKEIMKIAKRAANDARVFSDEELAAVGMPARDRLSPLQEVMMTGGEMLSQVPVPGGFFTSLAAKTPKVLKPLSKFTEYFGPWVDPKASNYLIGTGVGSAFNIATAPDEEELAQYE